MSIEDQARPLRQTHMYCVQASARYDFIITCDEVLLMRVSPLGQAKPERPGISPQEVVQDSMMDHGRLEYRSIRWGVHRDAQQSLDGFEELTVNFSLWILFILAGNSWQIGWDYKPLEQECLAPVRESNADKGGNPNRESSPSHKCGSDQESSAVEESSVSLESTQEALIRHLKTTSHDFVIADPFIHSLHRSMVLEQPKAMTT